MAHHTTSTRDAALLVRQLKGAPATILLMMLGIGRPTGRNELALLTTYSERTVQKSLDQLQFLGLAQQHARYHGWALTSAVRQQLLVLPTSTPEPDADPPEVQSLPLATPSALPSPAPEVQNTHLDRGASPPPTDAEVHALPLEAAPPQHAGQSVHLGTPNGTGEVQSLHLPSSSSSCSESYSHLRKKSQLQQPTTPRDPTPPPVRRPAAILDADALDAVQLLTATGCPHHTAAGKGARDAVQTALAGGWTGAEIYDHVTDWFDYVEHTEGIKHKGLFTAARIRNLEPAPPPRPKTADDYITEALERIVRH